VSIVLIEGGESKRASSRLSVREKGSISKPSPARATPSWKFRIKRIKSDTFTVKPAKLDLGKAVKEAVPANDPTYPAELA
jgi:hypothetical protein